MSFSLGKLRFIDSFGFLQTSLDALVGTNKPESPSQLWPAMKRIPPGASFYYRKGTTRTSTWTLGPALRRPLSRQRKPSTASSRGKATPTKTTPTRRRSGRRSNVGTLETFTTYISRRTCYSGRRFRELPKDMSEALQTRPGALLHKPWSFLGLPPQVHGYQPGTAHRCQQTPLCRKRLARWHIHGEQALLQGKQPLPNRLQPPRRRRATSCITTRIISTAGP